MINLLAKLLLTRHIEIDEGIIKFKNTYLNIIPSYFISELTYSYILSNQLYRLYIFSWITGYIYIYKIKKAFNLNTPDKIYSFGMDLAEMMGIGIYKTHEYFPGRYTKFTIGANPYIQHIPKKVYNEPIDYFIAGAMAGGGSNVHNDICQTVEVSCMYLGDSYCQFTTATKEELKRRNLYEVAQKRYKLDKILPLQQKIFQEYDGKNDKEVIDYAINYLNSI